jgi:hypothetical protein
LNVTIFAITRAFKLQNGIACHVVAAHKSMFHVFTNWNAYIFLNSVTRIRTDPLLIAIVGARFASLKLQEFWISGEDRHSDFVRACFEQFLATRRNAIDAAPHGVEQGRLPQVNTGPCDTIGEPCLASTRKQLGKFLWR